MKDEEAKKAIMETLHRASKMDLDEVVKEVETPSQNEKNTSQSNTEQFDPAYASIVPRQDAPRFPEPSEKIVISVDELSDFIKKLESMKQPDLKAAIASLYGKNKMFEQWYNVVKSEWERAVKSGASWVSIPAPPPLYDPEEVKYYKELFKLMAPFYLLNSVQQQGQTSPSITELTKAVKDLRDMAKEEQKKIKLKIGDQELEVEPEFALMYYTMFGGSKKSEQSEYVIIKDPDGRERQIPKDIYLVETVKELFEKGKEKEEPSGVEEEKLTGKLLSTINSLTNTLTKLSERIDKLEEKLAQSSGIKALLDNVNTLIELKTKLNTLFGEKKDNNKELLEILLKSGEEKKKEESFDIDMAMEKARQQGMYVERLVVEESKKKEEEKEKVEEKENEDVKKEEEGKKNE
ncbi:MAG: hypothetical protein DRG36_05375 [Deltaproteobacteria bacterium]|nr:MAG: hypothetical protein DRG36_05375 [Deltaproteobacteria bacterium]